MGCRERIWQTKSITRILLKCEVLTALNINKYCILGRGTVHGRNLQAILSLKKREIFFSFSRLYLAAQRHVSEHSFLQFLC